MASVHGDELAFLLGAPIAAHLNKPLAQFASNFSQEEVALSEAMIMHWTNFAKFG